MVDRDERLEELREMLDSETDIHPTDLVDRWEGWNPNYRHELVETKERVYIPTENIVGTSPMNTDRLVEDRLIRVVNKLATGEWDPEYDPIHVARHPEGLYYVSRDGNHRALAHKYFGIDTIYADVAVYRWSEQ